MISQVVQRFHVDIYGKEYPLGDNIVRDPSTGRATRFECIYCGLYGVYFTRTRTGAVIQTGCLECRGRYGNGTVGIADTGG